MMKLRFREAVQTGPSNPVVQFGLCGCKAQALASQHLEWHARGYGAFLLWIQNDLGYLVSYLKFLVLRT